MNFDKYESKSQSTASYSEGLPLIFFRLIITCKFNDTTFNWLIFISHCVLFLGLRWFWNVVCCRSLRFCERCLVFCNARNMSGDFIPCTLFLMAEAPANRIFSEEFLPWVAQLTKNSQDSCTFKWMICLVSQKYGNKRNSKNLIKGQAHPNLCVILSNALAWLHRLIDSIKVDVQSQNFEAEARENWR